MIVSVSDTLEDSVIEGYFTLAHKAFRLPSSVSNNMRRRIFGGVNKEEQAFSAVLIAQIGKHISPEYTSDLSGIFILNAAFSIIESANALIPCRNVVLECSVDKDKLHVFYQSYGFVEIQRDEHLIEYYRRLE